VGSNPTLSATTPTTLRFLQASINKKIYGICSTLFKRRDTGAVDFAQRADRYFVVDGIAGMSAWVS
jgi:hypothetical protein